MGSFEKESSTTSNQPAVKFDETQGLDSGEVATAIVQPTGIEWQPVVNFDRLVLTVSMPGGSVLREEFSAGGVPTFQVVGQDGKPRSYGQYVYELRVIPLLDQETLEALASALETGNDLAVMEQLKQAGKLPEEPLNLTIWGFYVNETAPLLLG